MPQRPHRPVLRLKMDTEQADSGRYSYQCASPPRSRGESSQYSESKHFKTDCFISSIGRRALHTLKNSHYGRVVAVFNQSLYLELDGGWCCLTAKQLGAGPFNISTVLPGRLEAIELNTGVVVSQGLFVGNQLKVAMTKPRIWRAPVIDWSIETLQQGIAVLDSLSLCCAPKDGLSRLVWPRSLEVLSSPECRIAAPVFADVIFWLRQALGVEIGVPPPKGILKLLGLGPGLTPSGDDFLVGMFVALSLCHRRDLVSSVDYLIRPLLDYATGPISRLHILSAMDGESGERFHGMINALLAGDYNAIASQLDLISLIGHSSGWDALAGAVTVLREVIITQPLFKWSGHGIG